MADNVKVVVRIRPSDNPRKSLQVSDRHSLVVDSKPYTFDCVFGENTTQTDLFNEIGRPAAGACLSGYNSSVFAYGQTGTGKTFSIFGTQASPGILPRAAGLIFQETRSSSSKEFLLKCSYLEIYQEQVIDLLNTSSENLQIREDIKRGVYVDGLTESEVSDPAEIEEILAYGENNRHVGATAMNKESSRSHCVFSIRVESREQEESGLLVFKNSQIHLIDLAGSERASGVSTNRLKETGMINKSLSVLGNVITSLGKASEGKLVHVHYRDSKLTYLLKDSLGGNSKTYVVVTVNSARNAISETVSSLKFGGRAKKIRNKAVVNQDMRGTVDLLRSEIRKLREKAMDRSSLCTKCGLNIEHNQFEMLFDQHVKLRRENESFLLRQIEEKEQELKEYRRDNKKGVIFSTSIRGNYENDDLKKLRSEKFKLESRILKIESENREMFKTTDEMINQLSETIKQNAIERDELKAALEQKAITTSDITPINSENDSLRSENGILKMKNDVLITENKEFKDKKNFLIKENKELNSENNKMKAELERLRAENDKLSTQSEVSKLEVLKLKQELNLFKEDLEEKVKEIQRLNVHIENLNEEIEKLRLDKLKNPKSNLPSEDCLTPMKKEKNSTDNEKIRDLTEENKRQLNVLSKTNKSILNTRSEINMWKQAIEEKNQQISELKFQLQQKNNKKQSPCRHKVDKYIQKYKYYKLKLESSENANLNLKEDIEQLKEEIEQKNQEIDLVQHSRRSSGSRESQVLVNGLRDVTDYVLSLPTADKTTRSEIVSTILVTLKQIYGELQMTSTRNRKSKSTFNESWNPQHNSAPFRPDKYLRKSFNK